MANFVNLYFTRYPIYNSEGFFLGDKVLSRHIGLSLAKNPSQSIVVFTTEPRILFKKLLFYNDLYNEESAQAFNQKISRQDFSYGNVRFVDNRNYFAVGNNDIHDYKANMECEKPNQPTARILKLADAGTLFFIKNDLLCEPYNLSRYPRVNGVSQLNVYKLSEEDFCETLISFL